LLNLIEKEQMESLKKEERNRKGNKPPMPATPIVVMQRVGGQLGILPEKLTKEKLEADPAISEVYSSHD
jgi:hypothetical protein